MSDHEKQAKMGVLHHLKSMAEDMMKGHMDNQPPGGAGGMKKVSVMSDSPEGLSEGLDKAKDLVQHDPLSGQHPAEMLHGDVNSPGHSTHGSGVSSADSLDDGGAYSEEGDEDADEKDEASSASTHDVEDDMPEEHMEPHHIDAKIKHLMDLKKRKMGQG